MGTLFISYFCYVDVLVVLSSLVFVAVVKHLGFSKGLTLLAMTDSSWQQSSWSLTEEGLMGCMAFACSKKELACGVFLRTACFFKDDYLIIVEE